MTDAEPEVIDVEAALAPLTVNELVTEAIRRANDLRMSSISGDEARDLAIAITHLEDGLTRYNSSRYRRSGSWHRRDPDRP